MNTVNEEVKPADAKPESEKLFHYCEANYANCLRPLMSISRDEFPSGESIQKHYKLYGKSKDYEERIYRQ